MLAGFMHWTQQLCDRRWRRLYFRRPDNLDALANLALVFIAAYSATASGRFIPPPFILLLALAYIYFTGWRLWIVRRRRRVRQATERRAICQLFHWLYLQLFGIAPDRRFTLFVVDPEDPDQIIPKVRYEHGKPQDVAELSSNAAYRRGEGFTGRAWEETSNVLFQPLPEFADHDAFTAYYVNTLKIRPEIVQGLSPYMEKVRSIYSYGYTDHQGHLLAVLSIDVKHTDQPIAKSALELNALIESVGGVLEAFSFERKEE